ncbi:ATPase [Aureococcus anophagefferens]|nr:ATPase [Aureococcus anophagefferens]
MPAKVATFVSQIDQHAPCLTLRANKVDAIMKVFGIDHVADTIVGDALRRGVSGGQRRRVTVAEMVMGARLICGGEITTGLDSQTAYELVHAIAAASKVFRKTSVVSTTIVGFATGTVFQGVAYDDFATKYGLAFSAVVTIGLGGMSSIAGLIDRRDAYKQRDAFFFPTLAYTLAEICVDLPIVLVEALVYANAVYWFVGFTASPRPRRSRPRAHGRALRFIFGLCDRGDNIPVYWLFFYWFSPVAWGLRAVLVNEFRSSTYDKSTPDVLVKLGCDPEDTDGVCFLSQFDFQHNRAWVTLRRAGKTTLLDVLAGRKTGGWITGNISLNGRPKDQKLWVRVSGYVEQLDVHSPGATVAEAVDFSRSSGCRTVLFLDEPTSGLDSRAALVVIRAVANVAKTNRSVICTIHQPSAALFLAFDRLLLLKKGGKMVYFGELGEDCATLVSYLSDAATSLGAGLPPLAEGQNPATWMLTAAVDPDADFADFYKFSPLAKANEAEVLAALEGSAPTRNPLLGGGLERRSSTATRRWTRSRARRWRRSS